ncbi:MAG: Aminoacylase-1 [Piptocephalis tieghemiana]|nr:MAG: Aminoacylase-1 [Piptocephalis tieghemiana]
MTLNDTPSEPVQRLQEYLRIRTIQPEPDHSTCLAYLEAQAKALNLPFKVYHCVENRPIALMTWEGTQPHLPSILLNSHTDVVPVYEEFWDHPPFSAARVYDPDRDDHRIYARGSQDMKAVGQSYLEAIRLLQAQGIRLARTLHLLFVPDEEVGGGEGTRLFVKTPDFKALNVGLALDEGIANPGEHYKLFYGERAPWWVKITTEGNTGHGSQFIENTASEKLLRVINRLMEMREEERKRLLHNPDTLNIGDVTSLNLTFLKMGVQFNVVPREAMAGFDIRVTPHVNLAAFKKELESIVHDAGAKIEYVQYFGDNTLTPIDASNKWWVIFSQHCQKIGVKLETEIFRGATDSRYIRELGIPAFGISPMNRTPTLLHDHNEFVYEKIYLEGIQFYVDLLQSLANDTSA